MPSWPSTEAETVFWILCFGAVWGFWLQLQWLSGHRYPPTWWPQAPYWYRLPAGIFFQLPLISYFI